MSVKVLSAVFTGLFLIGMLLHADPPKQFRVVQVPRMACPSEFESIVVESAQEARLLFEKDGSTLWPKFPTVDWRAGEILVVLLVKLKTPHDIEITGVNWDSRGLLCTITYRVGEEKPGLALEINGKAIVPDYVDYTLGVITVRPRMRPRVWVHREN